MANFQHEREPDSEDDCEVYFLKPVNEYNIIDKIKAANKELFSNEIETDNEGQQSRKVSFAANLEEYEPQNGVNLEKLEVALGIGCKANIEDHLRHIDIEPKLEVIVEEEASHEIEINEFCENSTHERRKAENHLLAITNKDNEDEHEREYMQLQTPLLSANLDENVTLEEICEEILILNIESDKFAKTDLMTCDSPGTIQRKMFKQITFDYTGANNNLDSESLTNLLINDNEDDTHSENGLQDYNCNEALNDETDTEDKGLPTYSKYYDDDDDEADKSSIIVASYLPIDMVSNEVSLSSSTSKSLTHRSKFCKLPFNKRFPIRRKTKSPNAIGSCSNNRRLMPPPEVTDLKLHYKRCCDFKNAQQQNLPQYTGYISEYGLSRQQLLERERKLQQRQRDKIVETIKASETTMQKMHDNERAFITWLKNKMRFPINKTRNMFDVNRPFDLRKCASAGGNTLGADNKHIINTTKYRKTSAKLKKA